MKTLSFNIKRNLRRAPKVYVLSLDKKITYGSFSSDNAAEFAGWDKLSIQQVIELKQFMHNMRAISNHFISPLNEHIDFRLRLPMSFVECINDISVLTEKSKLELDIFEPIVASIIQELRIVVAKLPLEEKNQAFVLLNKLGLAQYKKIDYSSKIQVVFCELLLIHKKSEKLEEEANKLFNKVKRISPKSIEDIAQGKLETSLWVVACAIEILRQEKPDLTKNILSTDDLFVLWAKRLLDQGHDYLDVVNKAHLFNQDELINKIKTYGEGRG